MQLKPPGSYSQTPFLSPPLIGIIAQLLKLPRNAALSQIRADDTFSQFRPHLLWMAVSKPTSLI